jgi:hypothetical protein
LPTGSKSQKSSKTGKTSRPVESSVLKNSLANNSTINYNLVEVSSNLVVKVEPAEIKVEPGIESDNLAAVAVFKRERSEPLEEGECSSTDDE